MAISKEQLKKRFERKTKTIAVEGDELTLRMPSPLEWSRYQSSLIDPKTGKGDLTRLGVAQMMLVASMLIGDDGKPLVDNYAELDGLDAAYYEQLKDECISFATGGKFDQEAKKVLGESEETPS
jgi:hypothetical protein